MRRILAGTLAALGLALSLGTATGSALATADTAAQPNGPIPCCVT